MTATLVEADPRNAGRAAERVGRLGMANVEVRRTDAGLTSAYAGAVPSDLVLLCGIFGNTVGVNRFISDPQPLDTDQRLFTFDR